jgi:hypothetical protein
MNINRLRLVVLVALILIVTGSVLVPVRAEDPTASSAVEEPPAPELLGPLTRQEIETAVPDWIDQEIRSTPDLETAAEMISSLRDAEVTIFFGSWCSDSKRELSRLWRAFDDLSISEVPEISYIGVDRTKKEPREYVNGNDIMYVPTVIVRRDGGELGRLVEASPESIESDLLSILQGTKSGLVTAKTELLEDQSSER